MNTRSTRGAVTSFKRLLALGQLTDVEFVSIQKAGSEELQTDKSLNFVSGQQKVSQSMDFRDTAAVSRTDL